MILTDSAETLAEQVERRAPAERAAGRASSPRGSRSGDSIAALPTRDRVFFNGLGGFTPDGREYVISLAPGQTTPAPWANVLANPQIGTVVTESGGAYTWVDNAHEFRLTPWHNDPVSDTSGEAFYLRDEETGAVLVADAAARARRTALRLPARLRLQRVRVRRSSGSARSCGPTSRWTRR